MTLSAGSTLNNEKYVIKEMLHQSDFGVIYHATHAYLEQPVTIQTFNDCVLLRGDYDQWRHLFLAEARRRASLDGEQPYKILDCFEEANLPFVVMQHESGKPLPKIQDWLPLMKPVTTDPAAASEDPLTRIRPLPPVGNRLTAQSAAIGSNSLSAAIETSKLPPETVSFQMQPSQPIQRSDLLSVSLPAMKSDTDETEAGTTPPARTLTDTAPAHTAPVHTAPVHTAPAHTAPANSTPVASSVTQRVEGKPAKSPQRPGFRQVLPIALTLTAIAGGLAGAAFGWLVRFEDTPPIGTEDTSLFNFKNEQDFPPVQVWPITETTEEFTPIGEATDPTADSLNTTESAETEAVTDSNSEANFYREAPVRTIRRRSRSDNAPPSERSVIQDRPRVESELAPTVEPEPIAEPKLEPEAIVPESSEPGAPFLEEQPPKLIEPPTEVAPPPPVEVPEAPIRKPVPNIAPEPAPSESAPISDFDIAPE